LNARSVIVPAREVCPVVAVDLVLDDPNILSYKKISPKEIGLIFYLFAD
jgi:hypothetical protein